jgi:predicted Zn-dependent protease
MVMKNKSLIPGVVMLALALCGAYSTVTRQAMAMTEQQELEIGKQGHQAVLQRYRVYNNPGLQKYVSYVGNKLAEKGDRPHLKYSFLVLDTDEVNAFALPGGYIYITRALMAYLNTEAELAAVLGHEIGHVTAKHAARQESAAKAANLGTTLAAILGAMYVPGLNPNISKDLLDVGSGALLSGYGRDNELEADQIGAQLLAKTGYEPQAIIDVISTLKDQESYEFKLARLEERKPHAYHGLFASHPDNDTRLREIVGTANQLKTDAPTYAGRDAYQNLINGLSYGQDVRQGIVIGRGLYHGPLGFAMLFPRLWQIDTSGNTTQAYPESRFALIQINYFGADPRLSPADFMARKLGFTGLKNAQDLSVNGLPAHTGQALVNTPYGQRLSRVTLIYYARRAYLITGMTKDTRGLGRYDDDFMDTTTSFRPMGVAERQAARQLRIRVIQADANTTYKSLAANSPLENLAEEQLRLINDDYPNGDIKPGDTIKIIQ